MKCETCGGEYASGDFGMCPSCKASNAIEELAKQIRIREKLVGLLGEIWRHRFNPSKIRDLFEAELESDQMYGIREIMELEKRS